MYTETAMYIYVCMLCSLRQYQRRQEATKCLNRENCERSAVGPRARPTLANYHTTSHWSLNCFNWPINIFGSKSRRAWRRTWWWLSSLASLTGLAFDELLLVYIVAWLHLVAIFGGFCSFFVGFCYYLHITSWVLLTKFSFHRLFVNWLHYYLRIVSYLNSAFIVQLSIRTYSSG